jgi:hypothetical protein
MSILDKITEYLNEEDETKGKSFSHDEAKENGEKLGVKWDKFDVEQFHIGMNIELEHGTKNPETNITDDDPTKTAKIALAHLTEFPDYYTRLTKLEKEAKAAKG